MLLSKMFIHILFLLIYGIGCCSKTSFGLVFYSWYTLLNKNLRSLNIFIYTHTHTYILCTYTHTHTHTHIYIYIVLCLVTQWCLTLCNPMDCSLPGSSAHWDSPGKNTGVGYLALLLGNLCNPGIQPRFPALQADSLPSEPSGKPIYIR